MKTKTQKLVYGALIAAIYGALTIFLAPISYGQVQIRIAEALTILPFFSSFSIWGLFIGCIVANIFSPVGILDIIFGSIATLLAAVITYLIGRSSLKLKKFFAPLPAVIVNAIIVGILINITLIKDPLTAAITGFTLNKEVLLITMLWVGIGEFIACYVIGLPLLLAIEKNEKLKSYFK